MEAALTDPIPEGRRECFNLDGRPKIAYKTIGEAVDFLVEHGTTDKRAYRCSHGCGFHVGSRSRRGPAPR
jgi:hypothetical protein